MSYESGIKSNVSIFLLSYVDAEHTVAVQRNFNLFEFCGENGVASLVPHGESRRSSSSP